MTTKCDIIRDAANAISCGMCAALSANPPRPIPTGCNINGITPPAAACLVSGTSNTRMKLFHERYLPLNLFDPSNAHELIKNNYSLSIRETQNALKNAYPTATRDATEIGWPDFGYCKSNNNKYYDRNDLMQLGMKPSYPIGGTFAEKSIWKNSNPIPVIIDYVMNPDLFTILVFAFLVIIFGIFLGSVSKKTLNKELLREQLEENDPFKGTAFESYPDPKAKCRKYIESMEQQG